MEWFTKLGDEAQVALIVPLLLAFLGSGAWLAKRWIMRPRPKLAFDFVPFFEDNQERLKVRIINNGDTTTHLINAYFVEYDAGLFRSRFRRRLNVSATPIPSCHF